MGQSIHIVVIKICWLESETEELENMDILQGE